jgi:hypothetical protein
LKYQGVTWHKSSNKWEAVIWCDGKKNHLGLFENKEQAARAYDRAARVHHGEKEQLNFPCNAKEAGR